MSVTNTLVRTNALAYCGICELRICHVLTVQPPLLDGELILLVLFLQVERTSSPEIQGVRMSRELTDGLVLQPQVVLAGNVVKFFIFVVVVGDGVS